MNIRREFIIRKIVLLILGIFPLLYYAHGQNGSPLLSHYRESIEVENQNWAICQDDNRIMMFANRRGILTFDGQKWDFIRIPVIPYTMKYKPDIKTVFIGSENNFGYLNRDEKGIYNYNSLSTDSINCGLISGIYFTDTTVWFYSETSLIRYNLIIGRTDLVLEAQKDKPFTGMFITPRNVFVNVFSEGLYRIESDTLFPLVTGYLLKDVDVLFSVPYDEKRVLIGVGGGKLLLFDGIKFYNYQVNDEDYLQQNYLSDGLAVSDNLYAFSTLDGGVLIIEKSTGNIKHTINYARGLPDDEVFGMGMDSDGGLWISHQYGLTRADLVLPVANFTIYPGLMGNIFTSVVYKNELYVATSEGVYYLTEEKQYEKVEVMIKEQPAPVTPVGKVKRLSQEQTGRQQETVVSETPKQKRGILSRIFGRKNLPQEEEIQQTQEKQKVEIREIKELPQPQPGYVKKTYSRLKSVDFVFKKVEGFDEKCRQMVVTDAGILATTNRGLMIISDHKARPLLSDRYIYSINRCDNGRKFWISSAEGYFYVSFSDGKWMVNEPDPGFRRQTYSVVSFGDSILWLSMDGMVSKVFMMDHPVYVYYNMNDDFPQRYIVEYINDTLFAFSESDIKYFNPQRNKFEKYFIRSSLSESNKKFVLTQSGFPWIYTGDEWICLNSSLNISGAGRSLLKVFDNIISIYAGQDNLWVVTGDNRVYLLQYKMIKSFNPDFHLFVKSVMNERGAFYQLSDIEFGSRENNVYFELVSPSYVKQNSIRYQYIVEKVMDEWSKWSQASTINLMLQPGKYTLLVRAKDLWGNISEPEKINFTIKTPFTRTIPFYILIVLAGLILIIALIKFRERRLQAEKRILEEKVKERTAELEAQKEEITSSIEYAGKIQAALLPSEDQFRKWFSDYLLIYKPRNIVSGDFYWIAEDENNIYFTVADCTGHGVPGAFMSALGISMLNEIITNNKGLQSNTLLNILRNKIIDSLHQTGKMGEATDGMDISFCILDRKKKKLQYSGAYNSLIIISDGVLREYKADKMPIGIYIGTESPFTNQIIDVKQGDIVYLFSDGITDQFGGPEGKKYKKSVFRKLLTTIHNLPLKDQKELIEKEYLTWKGNLEQVDDITVLGIKI